MKQFFVMGASSVYGVGAENGWADLVKTYLHTKMYGPSSIGERYEIFNFSKSGSTIEFIASNFDWIYRNYHRPDAELVILISVGGNDAKAEGRPDNFVCSPEDFRKKIVSLIQSLQEHATQIAFVGNGFVDDTKTNPKASPFDGGKSYFTNERRSLFNSITKEVCEDNGIRFIVANVEQSYWIKNCHYDDGLHPNQKGYEEVFKALKPTIDSYL